jgi:hypothetical protein
VAHRTVEPDPAVPDSPRVAAGHRQGYLGDSNASSSAAVQRRVAEGYSDTAGRLLANQSRNILNYVKITRNRLIPYRTELVREAIRADSDAAQKRDAADWQPFGN